MTPEGKYLSTTEAARRLDVTPQAVNKWLRQGLFPGAYKINPFRRNSPYRIPVEAVDSFEREREQSAPPPGR